MSTYPYRAYHFPMRADTEAQRVALAAVAAGRELTAAELDAVHPGAAPYLADPTSFLADEEEPRVGTPVRLARDATGATMLSIELCLHDDDFAGGGWVFWLWVLDLVRRPERGQAPVIGYEGLYRNDADIQLVRATADGIVVGDDDPIGFDAIEEQLTAARAWADES